MKSKIPDLAPDWVCRCVREGYRHRYELTTTSDRLRTIHTGLHRRDATTSTQKTCKPTVVRDASRGTGEPGCDAEGNKSSSAPICMSVTIHQNATLGRGPPKLLGQVLLLYLASKNKHAEEEAKLLGRSCMVLWRDQELKKEATKQKGQSTLNECLLCVKSPVRMAGLARVIKTDSLFTCATSSLLMKVGALQLHWGILAVFMLHV